jgi:hypothetical protein
VVESRAVDIARQELGSARIGAAKKKPGGLGRANSIRSHTYQNGRHGEGWPFVPSPGVVWGETTVTASEVKPNFSGAPVNWFQFWIPGRKKGELTVAIQPRPAASRAAKPTTETEAVRDRVFAARRRRADATQCLRQYLSRIVPVQAFRPTHVQVRHVIDGQRPNDRAESTYPRNRVSLIVHSTRIDTVVLALDSIREARIRVS